MINVQWSSPRLEHTILSSITQSQIFADGVPDMAFAPPNISNYSAIYENEEPVSASTPLIKGLVPALPVNYAGVAVKRNDEEAPCLSALPDKQPLQEIPRNVAGVISILLLGTSKTHL